jgi:hypothetical protein
LRGEHTPFVGNVFAPRLGIMDASSWRPWQLSMLKCPRERQQLSAFFDVRLDVESVPDERCR